MSEPISRRNFIKTGAISGVTLAGAFSVADALAWQAPSPSSPLYQLSSDLLQQWATALLRLQVTDSSRTTGYGGIYCPAHQAVHGRVADTIYPLSYLAATTKDHKYMDAAVLLYRWMETHVSQPDGSWLNEPVAGSWKGTTVFASIALAEALKHHGEVMDDAFKQEVRTRLKKAGDFIHNTFTIDYGNINYPITAAYGLSLLGEVLDVPAFRTKGRDLAQQALGFFTKKDGFLYGEGDPYYTTSKKGCYSVDLGYNVEESLPSLVMYGLLTKEEEVLQVVTRSLQTHMEFMLPDGGWDNSWGTRNYKWSYWGSRTSDGSQPAYGLLAGRDARFYKAALQNTRLLQSCTKDGLLYGGPHYIAHKVTPCVHHTFCHIKALTTLLDYGDPQKKIDVNAITLPREKAYGSRFFSDIQTWLIAKGPYRATVTGYDREYKNTHNGHASGGALSMLWHEKAGPLFAAGMNEYQLFEAGNMQTSDTDTIMTLTPRIELKSGGLLYMNICDLSATVEVNDSDDILVVHSRSKLVDKSQQSPAGAEVYCEAVYTFTKDKVMMHFKYDSSAYDEQVTIVFPIIAGAAETVTAVSGNTLLIHKEQSTVHISANHDIVQLPAPGGRVFNFVPGFEAVPLAIAKNDTTIEILIK